MTMSAVIRAEYHEMLARVLVKLGSVVLSEDTFYGWQDYDATIHLRQCGVATHGTPDEDTWFEFRGTFDENDTSEHGVMMPDVTCQCGKIRDRRVRISGIHTQKIAEAVFTELYEATHSTVDK